MSVAVDLQNRPFAVEPMTGTQLPDGIFDTALPRLSMMAQFRSDEANPVDVNIYFESASDPNIHVQAQTHNLVLLPGAVTMLSWRVDVSNASPGAHYVSFAVEDSNGNVGRAIRKIFVSRTSLDPDGTFVTEVPEGTLRVRIKDVYGPATGTGCDAPQRRPYENLVGALGDYMRDPTHGPDAWAPGPFLLHTVDMSLDPNPHYTGPVGELPFADPDWKTILAIIAVILIVAAMVVAIAAGIAVITVGTGGAGGAAIGIAFACCVGPASVVAASLFIGGMVAGIAAALGDFPGPFRVGQEATPPNSPGEVTVAEHCAVEFAYPEPIVPGTPFRVEAHWQYERVTLDAAGVEQRYQHNQIDAPANQHILTRYEVDAPDVVRTYQDPHWVVRGRFHDENDQPLVGGSLFVQCYLTGPNGEEYRFQMTDDGVDPDVEPNDGWYTGRFTFITPMSGADHQHTLFNRTHVARKNRDDTGLWRFFVVAQDINDADPNMTPEEAAAHLGGILLTGQAHITMSGGTCPIVPDGHINVV